MKLEDLTIAQLLECMEKDSVWGLKIGLNGTTIIDHAFNDSSKSNRLSILETMPSIQALLQSSGEGSTGSVGPGPGTTGIQGYRGHEGDAGIMLSEPLRPEQMEVQDFEQTVIGHIVDINKELLKQPKGEKEYIVLIKIQIPRTIFKEIRRRYRSVGWKKVDLFITNDDIQIGLYR